MTTVGTKHKYEYQVDLAAESAAAKVVRLVGSRKRVLELGPGPGSITRVLYESGACEITAIELDETAIEKVRPFCKSVLRRDLNQAGWADAVAAEKRFDVVVATDVLEHLYDPLATLVEIKRLLGDDGYAVISLPHVGHSAVVACLVDEDFAYQDYGLLDRTHIRFFGIKNMQKLMEDAGLAIVAAEFVVKAPEQTELGRSWHRMPDDFKSSLACNPFGTVYQVVIKAMVAKPGRRGLDLCSLPVPTPGQTLPPDASALEKLFHKAKLRWARYLSPRLRVRIGRMLERLGIRV